MNADAENAPISNSIDEHQDYVPKTENNQNSKYIKIGLAALAVTILIIILVAVSGGSGSDDPKQIDVDGECTKLT